MTVTREKGRLFPPKAMPTCSPTPLASAAIEILPVITVDVIRPVSMIPVTISDRFTFLAICSQTSISLRKYASISFNLFR